MNSDLMNVLGVLIAFITVMLVFSIAITSLVQATQGFMRFRARNLQNSLAKILKSVQQKGSTDDPKKNAISLLNRSDAALLSKFFIPDSRASRIFGPQVSWMDPDDLDRELRKNELGLDDEQMVKVSDKFRHTQRSMRKVFLRRIRLTTLLWAFVVAFYYQLSTPQLFHDFSEDTALQGQVEELARKLLEESGEGKELKIPTEPYFQLDPWSGGMAYYYEQRTEDDKPLDCKKANKDSEGCNFKFRHIQGSNLIGVLITVMLLSLGAPFWFDMLKKVVNLKDTLSKELDALPGDGTERQPAKSGLNDGRIDLLRERMRASKNPVLKASLQKEINDLRVERATRLSPP